MESIGLHVLPQSIVAQEFRDLYQAILKSFFGESHLERLAKLKKLQENMLKNNERINKAMQMMLDVEIVAGEYRAIKSRYEQWNTTLLKD